MSASFFMDIQLKEIASEKVIQEKVSLKSDPIPKQVHYEVEKKDLSKNIKKFDWKVKHKTYVEDPYAYNSISLGKNVRSELPTQTAEQMIVNKTYNTVGKVLGVDTVHDWNKYYDKVYTIVEWAKEKSKLHDVQKLVTWIRAKSNQVPALGAKRIDDLYIFAKMHVKTI